MTTTLNNYVKYNNQKDEDDMSLADIMSLKISTPTEEKTIWQDWAQNEHYQQIQASYYQLQYLQQQQWMSMMSAPSSPRSSVVSSNSSHSRYYRPSHYSISPSTSNTSVKQIETKRKSRPHRISTSDCSVQSHSRSSTPVSSNSSKSSIFSSPTAQPKSTSSQSVSIKTQDVKRRKSIGKRIKKVFRMNETRLVEKKAMVELPSPSISVDTNYSASIKSKGSCLFNKPTELPSPASSTVSIKKQLSFNPVIQYHETFSASEYNRRCDLNTTCQKLTPELALKIKEELNQFKLNDMAVHSNSRQFTHFFM